MTTDFIDNNTVNADEVASIYVQASLDLSQLNQDLLNLQNRQIILPVSIDTTGLQQTLNGLSNFVITPTIDLIGINNQLRTNPVKFNVDTTNINNELKNIQSRNIEIKPLIKVDELEKNVATKLNSGIKGALTALSRGNLFGFISKTIYTPIDTSISLIAKGFSKVISSTLRPVFKDITDTVNNFSNEQSNNQLKATIQNKQPESLKKSSLVKLNQEIQLARKNYTETINYINASVIVVKTDQSDLYRLNKHLDLKRSHLRQVINEFKNNPITPKFLSPKNVKLKVGVDINAISNDLSKAVAGGIKLANAKNPIQESLKNVGNSLKNVITTPFKTILSVGNNVFTGFTEQIGNTLSKGISEGLSNSLGSSLVNVFGSSSTFGKLIGGTINNTFSTILGDSKNVVSDVIKQIVGVQDVTIDAAYNRNMQAQKNIEKRNLAQQQIKKEYETVMSSDIPIKASKLKQHIDFLLPSYTSDNEKFQEKYLKEHQKYSKESEKINVNYSTEEFIKRKYEIAQNEIDYYKKIVDSLKNQGRHSDANKIESVLSNLPTANQSISYFTVKQNELKNEASGLSNQELIQHINLNSSNKVDTNNIDINSENFRNHLQDRYVNEGFKKYFETDIKEQENFDKLSKRDAFVKQKMSSTNEEKQLLINRKKEIDKLISEYNELQKQINIVTTNKKLVNISNEYKPESIGNYSEIVREIGKILGVNVDEKNIPTIIPASKLANNAIASYNQEKNTIKLSHDTIKKLNTGELNKNEYETIVHELRHAFQADFGKKNILRGETPGVNLISESDLTQEEIRRLGKGIEASTSSHNPENRHNIRSLEIDAYTFAHRNTDLIVQNVQRNKAIKEFNNSLGVGLINPLAVGIKSVNSSKEKIDKISEIAKTSNIDISQEIEYSTNEINKIFESFQETLSELRKNNQLEKMSVEQIQKYKIEIIEYSSHINDEINSIVNKVKESLISKKQNKTDFGKAEIENSSQNESMLNSLKYADILAIAKKFNISSYNSETKKKFTKNELVSHLLQNVNTQKLSDALPIINNPGKEILEQSREIVTLPLSELKRNIAFINKSIKQGLKESNNTIDLSKVLEDIHQQQILVQQALSLNIQDPKVRSHLEGLKLNLAKNKYKVEDGIGIQKLKQNHGVNIRSIPNTLKNNNELFSFNIHDNNELNAFNIGNIFGKNKSNNLTLDEFEKQEKLKIETELKKLYQKLSNEEKILNQQLINMINDGNNPSLDSYESIKSVTKNAEKIVNSSQQTNLSNNIKRRIKNSTINKARYLTENAEDIAILVETKSNLQKNPNRNAIVKSLQNSFNELGINAEKYGKNNTNENYNNLARSIEKLENNLNKAGISFLNINKEIDNYEKKLKKMQGEKTLDLNVDVKSLLPEKFNFLDNILSKFNQLKNSVFVETIINLVKAFSGFKIIGGILPFFNQLISSSLQVSNNFQKIYSDINLLDNQKINGTSAIQLINKQSRGLSLDREQNLRGFYSLATNNQGTNFDADKSLNLLKDFNGYMRSHNVDKQGQNASIQALQQLTSQNTLDTNNIKQLGMSSPGAYSMFARSQGLTDEQLNRSLSNGSIDNNALIKFGQQANTETSIQKLESYQALTQKVENNVADIKENIGNMFVPLQNSGIKVVADTLELVKNNLGFITTSVAFIGVKLAQPFLQPLIAGFNVLSNIVKSFNFSLKDIANNLIEVGKKFKGVALEFVAFYALSSLLNSLKNQFTDLTGSFGENIRKQTELIEEYKKLRNPENKDSSRNADWYQASKRIVGLNGIFGEATEKILSDKNQRFDENTKNFNYLTEQAKSKYNDINNTQSIDEQLKLNQTKQRALLGTNFMDAAGLKKLKDQENELIKQRENSVKPVASIQGVISGQVETTKNNIAYLKELRSNPNLYDKEVKFIDNQLSQAEKQLKSLEKTQDELTKSVGKTVNAFELLKQQITLIGVELEDTKNKIEKTTNITKQNISSRYGNGSLFAGDYGYQSSITDIRSQQQQYNALQSSTNQLKTVFNSSEGDRVKKSYKIDENTGANKLNYFAENTDNNNDKFILQSMAKYQQDKLQLTQISTQLTEARTALINQLKEQTIQVAEYYQNITRQIKESSLEIQKITNTNSTMSLQNRIRQALIGVGDNIYTQFGDSIIESLNSLNEIRNTKIDAQSKYNQLQNQLEDSAKSAIDLSRSIPSTLNDLNQISTPGNTSNTIDKLTNSIDNLSDKIKSVFEGLSKAIADLTKSINDKNQPKTEKSTLNPFDSLNTAKQQINDKISNQFVVSNPFDQFKNIPNAKEEKASFNTEFYRAYVRTLVNRQLATDNDSYMKTLPYKSDLTDDSYMKSLPYKNQTYSDNNKNELEFNPVIARTVNALEVLNPAFFVLDENVQKFENAISNFLLPKANALEPTSRGYNTPFYRDYTDTARNNGLKINKPFDMNDDSFMNKLPEETEKFNDKLEDSKKSIQSINTEIKQIDDAFNKAIPNSLDIVTNLLNKNNGLIDNSVSKVNELKTVFNSISLDNLQNQLQSFANQIVNVTSQATNLAGSLMSGGTNVATQAIEDFNKLTEGNNNASENNPFLRVANIIGNAINDAKQKVISDGKVTANAEDVNAHHGGKAYHTELFNGKNETFRNDGGINRLVKDIVLSENGSENARVHSPVAGIARVKSVAESGGYGNLVEILNTQNQVIARMAHLQSTSVKTGDTIQYGQNVGVQGNTGHSFGTHLHIEMPKELWTKYYADVNKGNYSATEKVCKICGGNNHSTQEHTAIANKAYENIALLQRTGKFDDKGLEKLALNVIGKNGAKLSSFIVNSGRPNTQNMFAPAGTTKSGSEAPVEYGNYSIGETVSGMSASVGKSFIPLNPGFNTDRSNIGLHVDADRNIKPGSSGCIVFENEQEFNKFNELIRQQHIKKFIFDNKGTTQKAINNQVNSNKITNTQISIPNNNQGGILWGKAANYQPSDLSGLTATGKKALAALSNPNVRAVLDAIAVAENGNIANTTGGYGVLVGHENKDSFDPNKLMRHPGVKGIPTSDATGRYQTMSYVWNDDTAYGHKGLGLRDFKPQSQEILAVARLMYRGVLEDVMKGDIQSALKPHSNKYRNLQGEWASLQGNLYGQGTEGGKLPIFLNNVKKFAGNPAMQGYYQNKAVDPRILQQQIQTGYGSQVTNLQQQQDLLGDTTQKKIDQQIAEFQRKNETALRTFRRDNREIFDTRLQSSREVADLTSNIETYKSPGEQFIQQTLRETVRKYDDVIKERQRKLEDIDENVKAGQNLSKELQANINEINQKPNKDSIDITALQSLDKNKKYNDAKLIESQKQKAQLESDLKQVTALKDTAIKEAQNIFSQQEFFRLQGINFETTGQQINKLQSKVEQFKAVTTLNPLAKEQLEIPELQKLIDLKNVDLETEKNIADVQKRYFEKSLTANQANEEIENYKKLSILKQESIEYTAKETEFQTKLNYQTNIYNKLAEERTLTNETLQTQITEIQLQQRRNPSIGDSIPLQYQVSQNELLTQYNQKKLGIQGNKLLSPDERTGQYIQQAINYKNQLKNLEEQTKLDEEQRNINKLQTYAERNKTQQDFVNNNAYDSRQKQIDLYKSYGGNEFTANKASRELEKFKEEQRYSQQLMDFKTQQAQLKFQGIDIDPKELDQVASDMQKIHDLNIADIDNKFKSFARTLEDMTHNSVMGLSGGLTDVIMGTKKLSQAFDDMFKNILNQFLNQGIQSIFSQLLGGGGLLGANTLFGNANKSSGFSLASLFGGGASIAQPQNTGLFSLLGGGNLINNTDWLSGLFGGGSNQNSRGITSDLFGLFTGGGGLFGFSRGGVIPNYALGGLTKAMSKEARESGKKPQLAVVHEGEMMIPAWRTQELASMGLGQHELLGYADGGIVGNIKMPTKSDTMNVHYETTVINNQSYVTSDQFEQGIKQAAKAGAEGGVQKMQFKLANSASFRKSTGIS